MIWISCFAGQLATISLKKATKSCAGVPGRGLSVNLSRLGVERCVQRQRAVPEIFKAVALGASRAQRQHRVEAIQRLNGALFIHTKHRRVLRRMEIEADDVSGFASRNPDHCWPCSAPTDAA